MTLDQSALLQVLDQLRAAEVGDRVRQAAETIYQALIEAELTAVIGAEPHQRTDTRTVQRNGGGRRGAASFWSSDGGPRARCTGQVRRSWRTSNAAAFDPSQVHLHGRDVDGPQTPYFAGFQMRYFRSIPRCFTTYHGVERIEVVHPTRTLANPALRIASTNPELLTAATWT